MQHLKSDATTVCSGLLSLLSRLLAKNRYICAVRMFICIIYLQYTAHYVQYLKLDATTVWVHTILQTCRTHSKRTINDAWREKPPRTGTDNWVAPPDMNYFKVLVPTMGNILDQKMR